MARFLYCQDENERLETERMSFSADQIIYALTVPGGSKIYTRNQSREDLIFRNIWIHLIRSYPLDSHKYYNGGPKDMQRTGW
jgi:hypothetical protein